MALSRSGLQAKILLLIAVTVVSVVAVSTYLAATWLTRLPIEEEVYRKALGQAKLTAHEVGNDLALGNPEEAQRIIRQVQRDAPGIVQGDLYLHSPAHKLLVSTDQGGNHSELDRLPGVERYNEFERPEPDQISIETPDSKYWIISTGVRQRDGTDGCLVLKVSKSRSNMITRDLVKRNLVVMLASLIAIVVAIHFFFQKNVGIPITEMIQVMEAAEGGQLDVRAHVPPSDELGQLGDHLNRMLGRLENFNNELNRINEELFETQRTLARSQRLAVAGQLAASLAHEIGTPLNSISGHVQLMARRKTGDEATDRRLQIIEKQIDSIVHSVKQLLSWTRKFELRVAPVDLRHVLEETILLSSAALHLRNIKVESDLAGNCPLVYGDAGYLQQVFLNLVNNSMDAMPRGGLVKIRLTYPHDSNPAEVEVKMSDTGEGIASETLRRIFDPMFTTKRMGAGTGLGLAICKQIITQHAGTIEAESEPGRGARFTIVLPIDCRDKLEVVGIAASTENG